MKTRYLLPLASMLLPGVTPVANAETPTELVVDVYAKPKTPKMSGYGRPADQIAQSTAHIKGKDAAKTGSNRLEDFADYVPGVQTDAGSGGSSVINVRGSRLSQAMLDGLPDVQGFYLRDPATVASVEISKGLDATLFGSGLPGGSFGYTSKKPSFTPKRTLSLLTGTPSQVRGLLDITGALRDQEWAGNLLIGGQRAETGYANVQDDRYTLMPSLLWNDDKQTLFLNLEHGWQNREANDKTIFHKGAPLYNLSYVDPRSSADRQITRFALDYSRELNDNWEASLQASHIKSKRKETHIGIGIPTDDNPDEWYDYYRKLRMDQTQTALRAGLRHQRHNEQLRQQTSLGFFAHRLKNDFQLASVLGQATLNVYQPVFDYPLVDDSLLRTSQLTSVSPERAWYLQHHTMLRDKLGINAGIRASHASTDASIPGFSARSLDARDTSTSLGLTWQATPQWQWFASHNESFSPNNGWDRNQNLFEPEQGVQHETGIRYTRATPAGQAVKANVSVFRIRQKNVTTPDPLDPDHSVLTGAQQAKGMEASLEQPINHKLYLKAGYSYLDARITSSNEGLAGKHIASVPRHSSSLQLGYTPKADTKLSLGVVRVGKRPGDNANSFEVDGYTRLDASAQWQLDKNTTLQAGVQNLLDKDYIAAASDTSTLVQGRKRTLLLGLEVAF